MRRFYLGGLLFHLSREKTLSFEQKIVLHLGENKIYQKGGFLVVLPVWVLRQFKQHSKNINFIN
jgi:hypothetical protein